VGVEHGRAHFRLPAFSSDIAFKLKRALPEKPESAGDVPAEPSRAE
jgi:hypothetical protein